MGEPDRLRSPLLADPEPRGGVALRGSHVRLVWPSKLRRFCRALSTESMIRSTSSWLGLACRPAAAAPSENCPPGEDAEKCEASVRCTGEPTRSMLLSTSWTPRASFTLDVTRPAEAPTDFGAVLIPSRSSASSSIMAPSRAGATPGWLRPSRPFRTAVPVRGTSQREPQNDSRRVAWPATEMVFAV